MVLWHQHRYLVLFLVAISIVLAATRRSFWKPRKRLLTSLTPSSRRQATRHDGKLPSSDLSEIQVEKSTKSEGNTHITTVASSLSEARPAPKRVIGSRVVKPRRNSVSSGSKIQPLIFFSSLTGTTEQYVSSFARNLQSYLNNHNKILKPEVHNLSYIEYDDYFITTPRSTPAAQSVRHFYLLLLPTYNIDTINDSFLSQLRDTHHDFRIDTAPLSDLTGYSVFGFGDQAEWKTEQEGYCSQALEVDKWMARLTFGKRAFPVGTGDVKSNANDQLMQWTDGVGRILLEIANYSGLGQGILGSGDALESDEGEESPEEEIEDEKRMIIQKRRQRRKARVDDLEDIRGQPQRLYKTPISIDFTTTKASKAVAEEPKEMVPVTSPTYSALTKQGYTIIGSHSGVKICRWTKSALRGRGSCYKYSFYGIKSHLCMETTPSLSCSNKCVFCWRHGTNPVGTTWRWKVDPPEMIFQGAKEEHLKKIKAMRGVPGVRSERFQEAMRIRHCALSLVGEPIFYPHINQFLRLLHAERISSFLVCNAQHPEQLAALDTVTQLYVSIDASNKESLRKVDRPLHRDFWERFLQCLDILRERRFQMRTVFRLTLVKGFNIEDEAEGYADLVARGLPCFVEVKGVTYCGTSTAAGAGLTMQNVPFYEEVVAFVEALNAALGRRSLGYGIAAEHAHSCCILIASNRFLIDGKWHTLIDYDNFFACLEGGEEFAPEDYVAPTPEWATFGNGGFDPNDERVYRKGKHKGEVNDRQTLGAMS